jgi:ribonuclease HII
MLSHILFFRSIGERTCHCIENIIANIVSMMMRGSEVKRMQSNLDEYEGWGMEGIENSVRARCGAQSRICGIDEVGRGALAGPVVAAAVILNYDDIPSGIKDSKLLSASRRVVLSQALMQKALVGIGESCVNEIDNINILQASLLAMTRAVKALPCAPDYALVDGIHSPCGLYCPVQTVVGGDRSCIAIAAASIVAKVFRDNLMAKLSQLYPEYGWCRNVGYGVKKHQEALLKYGVTPHHRKSFRPVRFLVATPPSDASEYKR